MAFNYMEDLRLRTKLAEESRQQGWTKDGAFILGDTYLMPNGESMKIQNVVSDFSQQGSLAKWADATACLNHKRMAPEAFTVLLAFAAPLIKFTNTNGVIVVPYGVPHAGKTVIADLMMSVWGNPRTLAMPTGEDLMSRMDAYDRHHCLPLSMDGGANYFGMADIVRMSNDFAAGASRVLTSPNSQVAGRISRWSTVMLMSGYESVYQRIIQNIRGMTPAHAPIMEYRIGENKTTEYEKATSEIIRASASDYGRAGLEYARYLVTHRDTIIEYINVWQQSIRKRAAGTKGYENVVNLIACAEVGGIIAEKLGIIRFVPHSAIEFAIQTLRSTAATMRQYYLKPVKVRVRNKATTTPLATVSEPST